MNYEVTRKAESFKENTDKFMEISKELLNMTLKDSVSLGYLASMDAETLAMIGKLNDMMKCCEEMLNDYCALMTAGTAQLDKLDKIEGLDDKLDRIEEKLDKLDIRQKQSNK